MSFCSSRTKSFPSRLYLIVSSSSSPSVQSMPPQSSSAARTLTEEQQSQPTLRQSGHQSSNKEKNSIGDARRVRGASSSFDQELTSAVDELLLGRQDLTVHFLLPPPVTSSSSTSANQKKRKSMGVLAGNAMVGHSSSSSSSSDLSSSTSNSPTNQQQQDTNGSSSLVHRVLLSNIERSTPCLDVQVRALAALHQKTSSSSVGLLQSLKPGDYRLLAGPPPANQERGASSSGAISPSTPIGSLDVQHVTLVAKQTTSQLQTSSSSPSSSSVNPMSDAPYRITVQLPRRQLFV